MFLAVWNILDKIHKEGGINDGHMQVNLLSQKAVDTEHSWTVDYDV